MFYDVTIRSLPRYTKQPTVYKKVAFDRYVYIAYTVYMHKVQYTIRGIPADIDQKIRKRARRTGKSFNSTVLDIIQSQVQSDSPTTNTDIYNQMFSANSFGPEFDVALEDLSKIDAAIWQ